MVLSKTTTSQSKKGHSILIRSATPDDAKSAIEFDIITLENGRYFNTTVDEVTRPTEEQYQKRIVRYQEEAGSLLLVAEYNNQLIGKLEFRSGQRKMTSHAGYIDMAIHPDFQNQGIGAILISHLLEWAKTHPTVEVIKLDVAEENSPAVGLYKKLGFKEVGRDPYASKKSGKFQAGLAMLLKLEK
jgi:ribosomal protein S18 acetylase RimI-like enzyme